MSDPDLSAILHQEKGASRRGRLLVIGLAILLGIGALVWWRMAAASTKSGVRYVTEPLATGSLRVTVTATGNLEPTNEVTVGSELSGTTREVYVDTNDQVTKNQPLAKLDTTKLEQQTESSRATAAAAESRVAQAQATLVESEADLKRLEKLREASGGKLPSQADMDAAVASAARAKADLASAQAEVRQAQANVGANESDLEKSTIRSPIDGIVLTRDLEPGQTVAATMTAPELFVVAEKLESMKLEVAVAEADIGRVKAGQAATFTVDAWPNREFEATVRKVEYGSEVTDNVVTYLTELEVTNDNLELRPGMTATAEITVAQADNVLLVPNAALRFDPASTQASASSAPKKSFVQSLIPGPPRRSQSKASAGDDKPAASTDGKSGKIWILRDGRPVEMPVEIGLSDGRVTEVSGNGLADGQPIIIHAATNGK